MKTPDLSKPMTETRVTIRDERTVRIVDLPDGCISLTPKGRVPIRCTWAQLHYNIATSEHTWAEVAGYLLDEADVRRRAQGFEHRMQDARTDIIKRSYGRCEMFPGWLSELVEQYRPGAYGETFDGPRPGPTVPVDEQAKQPCTCTACASPQEGVPGVAHCAACCGGTRVESYDPHCSDADHRALARKQWGTVTVDAAERLRAELDRLRAMEGRAVHALGGGSPDADQIYRDGWAAAADAILTYSHGGMRAELEHLRALADAAVAWYELPDLGDTDRVIAARNALGKAAAAYRTTLGGPSGTTLGGA